ncbi:tetraspanin-4 isoform X11 [Cygnus olor]|uniref:tetraspanin-4 isoform X11 n=1 Tax=Cygnus olor TaxID=8869 RepID=UPI001ADE814B|nr:tetraspanin-4 isoform X11 [Cygnus olor]
MIISAWHRRRHAGRGGPLAAARMAPREGHKSRRAGRARERLSRVRRRGARSAATATPPAAGGRPPCAARGAATCCAPARPRNTTKELDTIAVGDQQQLPAASRALAVKPLIATAACTSLSHAAVSGCKAKARKTSVEHIARHKQAVEAEDQVRKNSWIPSYLTCFPTWRDECPLRAALAGTCSALFCPTAAAPRTEEVQHGSQLPAVYQVPNVCLQPSLLDAGSSGQLYDGKAVVLSHCNDSRGKTTRKVGRLWNPWSGHLAGCYPRELCHPLLIFPIPVGCQPTDCHRDFCHDHWLRGLHRCHQRKQVPPAEY